MGTQPPQNAVPLSFARIADKEGNGWIISAGLLRR